MVYPEDFEVKQSSFALSKTDIVELLDRSSDVKEKRNRLPERIQRLIYDVAIFSQAGRLNGEGWGENWDDLLRRYSEEETEDPVVEDVDIDIYTFGKVSGRTLRRLQHNPDPSDRISLLVGILDGVLSDNQLTLKDQKELREIHSAIDTLFESYKINIEVMADALTDVQYGDSIDWEEAKKYGIKLTTGSQLLILSKMKLNPEYSIGDAFEEVLEESKLAPFDELAEFIKKDLSSFTQLQSGSFKLIDGISGIVSLEKSSPDSEWKKEYSSNREGRYTAKDIAAATKGSDYKSNAGRVLGNVSDSTEQEPWSDRPVIYKYESRPAAEYELTAYGRLLFNYHTQEPTTPRVRLHKLAWYDYWKTSETATDILPEELLGSGYEQELEIATKATEEILS